jgi:hypothetical protein
MALIAGNFSRSLKIWFAATILKESAIEAIYFSGANRSLPGGGISGKTGDFYTTFG